MDNEFPWPIEIDADPKRYRMALRSWHNRHLRCPGHFCIHDSGSPCPTPPPVPHFTKCPPAKRCIADLRLGDCGGCKECKPGHRCHLNGVENNCMGNAELPLNALTCWADYELIAAVSLYGEIEELQPEKP